MTNPWLFGYASKTEALNAAEKYWNPDKTRFWQDEGIPLLIGQREGYVLHDVDGHRLIDVHLNGGTYNLGHRNPELIDALTSALQRVDIGNHHFPAPLRTRLAETLLSTVPQEMCRVAFVTSGSEAIDLAIKSARYATGKRVIVSIQKAYHGHTGLAVATGDARFAKIFNAERPDEFRQVPLNDIDAMAAALAAGDIAAVIMETIPATYGFPMPAPGYLAGVKQLCERHGALYIADEVQTGLMRTGELWAIARHNVTPDILVTSKGLGGGIYPVGALIMRDAPGAWLDKDGFAHMSTFGGSELGCAVALKVLEITLRPATRQRVADNSAAFTRGLRAIQNANPDWFCAIRQAGLIFGLQFNHPQGAKPVMSELYKQGIWAIFSTLDPSVLQFKPGLLLSEADVADILRRLAAAIETTGAAFRLGQLSVQ
ncbi:aspartate aminotransferase family protein [Affinibrenneria salicis]|uniref:Aspartate aminotransferase family protein n=1 Tax=Affinibrenneria salicis TaxID=2590031 RepID=A0A5J5FUX0_9GAMM|nr:aminotransferase class III-fold pyridoxal phosphate-dependent enzyme [Affinibrenneria salicis]KAA8996919.1 aspartate aminotransferase family protein [Affinibrenneria salicis]